MWQIAKLNKFSSSFISLENKIKLSSAMLSSRQLANWNPQVKLSLKHQIVNDYLIYYF